MRIGEDDVAALHGIGRGVSSFPWSLSLDYDLAESQGLGLGLGSRRGRVGLRGLPAALGGLPPREEAALGGRDPREEAALRGRPALACSSELSCVEPLRYVEAPGGAVGSG